MSNLQDLEQKLERVELQVFNYGTDNDKIKFAINILEKVRKLLIYEWEDLDNYGMQPNTQYSVGQTNRVIDKLIKELEDKE